MAISPTAGITVALLVGIAGVAAITYRVLRRTISAAPAGAAATGPTPDTGDAAARPPPYSTETIQAVLDECFKLAFGVGRFDYHIIGEHAQVLERVRTGAAESVHQREYFPRRPMLLPKLLQALNDTESTRQTLVKLILEDPALAGGVLQRANSAFYRLTPEPIDSLDRAVQMLGTEGLRSILATAILQPVFRLQKGYFDSFAPISWEQAQRTAAAAEAYANATRSADPFVAQLLGLLGALARIVLFKLTTQMYRKHPNVLPRAEVFIRSMQAHGARVAGLAASTWELSDPSIAALREQEKGISPALMSPLGRAVYFSNLCGALALLGAHNAYSANGAYATLVEQGLACDVAHAMWFAATAAGEEQ